MPTLQRKLFQWYYINLKFNMLTDRQKNEQLKRKLKYDYPLSLLINGKTVKETVLLTNTNTTIHVTERTIQRLKKEFIDNINRY